MDDYSELVYALQQNAEGKANKLLEEVMYRLKDYLKVVLNASESEAEECTQQVFINVFEQIKRDNINDEKYIFRYMIRACRHEYFRITKENKRYQYPVDDYSEHLTAPAQQLERLMEEDRQRALRDCFRQLSEENQTFIEYFFENPDSSGKQASQYFSISNSSARAKKSRILKELNLCVTKKIED